jgi:hypothetical protein
MRFTVLALLVLATTVHAADPIPLNDLGTAPYNYGYTGGLYDNGANVIPPDHFAAGLRRAARITPRDAEGRPSTSGKIALIAGAFRPSPRSSIARRRQRGARRIR